MSNAPWSGSFEVEGQPSGHIRLEQIDAKYFEMRSTVRYIGEQTGLENKLSDEALTEIRVVSPKKLPTTDLTTVWAPLRWFVGRYGVHTPAALIHDWLIPQPSTPPVPDMTDEYADRYFRFMLEDLGVRLIRRWLMWAAVAARTRWAKSWLEKLILLVWAAASLAGMRVFIVGVAKRDIGIVILATLAPLLFALMWRRQYGAGIVAAYSAPWILPPTLLAIGGYWVYIGVEFVVSLIVPSRTGTRPFRFFND